MSRVKVSRYQRRHAPAKITKSPSEQKRVVEAALRKLHELGEDGNMKHVCRIEISDDDSQVFPNGEEFKKGDCSVINIEPADAQDVPEAVTTLEHESGHARDIAVDGSAGISKGKEISRHHHTIGFLKRWKRKERSARYRKRIEEEQQEEKESIEYLEEH